MSTDKQPSVARRDPADLAPSVDRDWANEFILELRMLDVPGHRIGDALVTVEAHVRDSGEAVGEAFGDAIAYARQLARDEPGRAVPVTARSIIAAVVGLLGMFTLPAALTAWLEDTTASITAGQLAVAALALALLLGFALAADRALRVLVRRAWVGAVGTVLFLAAAIAIILALPTVVVELPPLLLGGAGLLLLAVSTALSWSEFTADDSVLAPGEQPPSRGPGRRVAALIMPAFALVILLFTWVMHLLA
ncbi:hypothetical protein SAMN04487783_1140 [Agrococcus baldri]|uniref:Uncharacterized protein n=1 Tax=Agrococcus baldri TaxID=153730 RepID=A0AA94KZA0_9MICO|nr:hypothetical protein [Agrococcus baldri]SFS08681.1 hypothetical protein SAMN04487783_1140 [Agrococcus baldri]